MEKVYKRWFLGTWTTPYSHGIMHHAIIRCANGDIARASFEKRTTFKEYLIVKPILRRHVFQYRGDPYSYPVINEDGKQK